MDPDILQPPSPGSFVWFSLICSRRGGSTEAHLLSTRARRWQVARQGPRLGFVAETGSFVTIDALSTIFLLLVLLLNFLLFLRPHPGIFLFVLLRPCSSHLLRFSNYVFLCNLYAVSPQDSFCFICFTFRSSYFLGWHACRALVPGTLTFDLSNLINSRLSFSFLCLTV